MSALKTLIVYGDCQAEATARVLERDPVVSKRARVIYSRSYEHPVEERQEIDRSDVARCAILCEQHDPSGFRQRDQLPADCHIVRFPALDCNLLWPFNCPNPYNEPEPPVYPFGRFPYGDRVIVAAIDQGLPPDDILDYYLNRYEEYKIDLDHLLRLETARIRNREATCEVKMADKILERYTKERLFWAINHPTNALLEDLIEQLLYYCGPADPLLIDADPGQTLSAYFGPQGPLGAASIPIHPEVAKHFGLTWYDPKQRFRTWDGSTYSYEQYFETMIRYAYRVKALRQPA